MGPFQRCCADVDGCGCEVGCCEGVNKAKAVTKKSKPNGIDYQSSRTRSK